MDPRVSLLGLLAAGAPSWLYMVAVWAFGEEQKSALDLFQRPTFEAQAVYGAVFLIGAPIAFLLAKAKIVDIALVGLAGAAAAALWWSVTYGAAWAWIGSESVLGDPFSLSNNYGEYSLRALYGFAGFGALGGVAYALVARLQASTRQTAPRT